MFSEGEPDVRGSAKMVDASRVNNVKYAIRRSYKKSRRGCKTCKARKVKCDEKRPVCGACARRFVGTPSCEFDPFIPSVVSDRTEMASIAPISEMIPLDQDLLQRTLTPYPNGASRSDPARSIEMRLMHHYSIFTCSQLPDSPAGNHVWQIDIPRMAFQSDLVLDAIMGIASQHLYALTPGDKSLAHASTYYFDRAISKHRTALACADRHSAEFILAAAILITHCTWISSHVASANEHYELPLKTYYMARGIQQLFRQMFPWLANSGYLWYVDQPQLENLGDETTQSLFLLSGKSDLAKLMDYVDSSGLDEPEKMACGAMIDELSATYTLIVAGASQSMLRRRVATMPVRSHDRFLELTEQKSPIAMALLARNLALLKVLEPIWWLHGLGEHQVAERSVQGINGIMPPNWRWMMEWPLKVLSGEITLDDPWNNPTAASIIKHRSR